MGVVLEAFHPDLKRRVALKVLIAGEDASEEAIARFHREAESVAKLGHHPHIVPVHDIGKEGRIHYFAMHFVDGKSLDKMIDDGEIAPKRAAVIAKKLAEALKHAHDHGILHRDVKPSNVIMAKREGISDSGFQISGDTGRTDSNLQSEISNPYNEPMLTDFGLARDVGAESKMTRSGATLGTPHYMPPEQADGRIEEIDERSDVYALGATLYEMLAFRPPFEGKTVSEIIRKVLFTDPVSPRRINPLVDRDLATICMKCLEKEPERRYAGARHLAEDLQRYVEGKPILARPLSLWERLIRKARRNRALTATTIAAVLILGAGALLSAGLLHQRALEHEDAEDRARQARAETDIAYGELGKSRRVSRVLLGALGKLGRIHAELKRNHLDATKSPEERRDRFRAREKEIKAFARTVPPDPASQATLLAVQGWLLRLGGFEAEAWAAFEKARRTDREVAWGHFFEAMARLAIYLGELGVPGWSLGPGGLTFDPLPGENDVMKSSRERFEALMEGARDAKVWGADVPTEFEQVIQGLGKFHRSDLAGAEAGLTRALALAEMTWMEEEILLARTRIRYLQKDFDGATEDVRALLDLCPDDLCALLYLAELQTGRGAEREKRAEPSEALYRQAVETFGKILVRARRHRETYLNRRAVATWRLGEIEKNRGIDPRPRYRKAIEDLTGAVGANPAYSDGYANRGNVHLGMGEAEGLRGIDPLPSIRRAISDFDEALRRDPSHPLAQHSRGFAFRQLGQAEEERGRDPRGTFRKAIQDFDEVLRREPGRAERHVDRGNVYNLLGEAEEARGIDGRPSFEKAIADMDETLGADPSNAQAFYGRGMAHQNLGRAQRARGIDPAESFRRALSDFDEALERNPADAVAYTARGTVRQKLGDGDSGRGLDPRPRYRKAVEDFDEALRRNPEHIDAYNNRGNALWRLGRAEFSRGQDPRKIFRESIADFGEALKRNPAFVPAYNNRGNVYWNLGAVEKTMGIDPRESYRSAAREYEEALKRNPAFFNAHNGRGTAYQYLGQEEEERGGDPAALFAKALESYRNAVKFNPSFLQAHANMGFLLERLGRFKEATEAMEKAVRISRGQVKHLTRALERIKAKAEFDGEKK